MNDYATNLLFRVQVAPNIFHLRFVIINDQDFAFVPGQYVIVQIGQAYRQFSIVAFDKKENTLDLLIGYFKGGIASEYFIKLKIGEEVLFKGPAGIFIQRPVVRPVIYLATGTGIAPIVPMISQVLDDTKNAYPIYLFWGISSKKDVYFTDIFINLVNKNNLFQYALCLSRESDGVSPPYYIGRIQDNISPLMKELKFSECDIYVCGGKEAVLGLKEFVETHGVKKENLYFERFN